MKRINLLCVLAIYILLPWQVNGTARKITASEASDIVKKLADWYKDTENFSVNVEMKSFKDYESEVVHDVQTGFTRKNGRNFHSYMMGVHTIQNNQYQITIDTARNYITVKDAAQNIWENINPLILEKYLKESADIILTENAGDFTLKIVPSANSTLKKYELVYDKAYRIKSIKMQIHKEEVTEDGKSMYSIYPKVTFRFYNYSTAVKSDTAEYLTSTYLNINPTLSPKPEYSHFEFMDLRYKDKLKK